MSDLDSTRDSVLSVLDSFLEFLDFDRCCLYFLFLLSGLALVACLDWFYRYKLRNSVFALDFSMSRLTDPSDPLLEDSRFEFLLDLDLSTGLESCESCFSLFFNRSS